MTWLQFLVDTPIIWQIWYAHLIPAYVILIFAPRSRLADRVFGSGLILALPIIYLMGFTVAGVAFWGLDLFRMLLTTARDLGHLQVTAAFCVTATAADTIFASIFFRRYPDLPLVVKLFCGFWMLMVGWLLGIVILLVVRRLYTGTAEQVRIGPFLIGSA